MFYQFSVLEGIKLGKLDDLLGDPFTMFFFRASQVWILGIGADQILHLLFVTKTKRLNLINGWKMLDFGLFIMIILISVNFPGGFFRYGENFTKSSYFYVGLMHAIVVLLIWLKFVSVILVDKVFGPFLSMIYFTSESTLNFFIILISLYICGAGVFTAVFSTANDNFSSFEISLRTLFADSVMIYDLEAYSKYIALGGVTESFYLMVSSIVLMNLLISIITDVYEFLIKKVDSEHRSVTISYTEKYTWDKNFGILIFLPSPLSSVVLLVSPLVLFNKNPAK